MSRRATGALPSRLGASVPLIALPLALFGMLAVAAARVDGRLAGDDLVMDVLNGLAPVSSDDVHIDPVLEVTTVVVGAVSVALGFGLLVRRRFRAALFLAAAVGIAVLLSRAAKEIVARPAIEGPGDGYSFPSGSACWLAVTLAALYLVAGPERERGLLLWIGVPVTLAYAAIIAWEEWHHPSDVLAGWCLGLATAAAAWMAFGRPRAELLPRARR